MSIFSRLCAAYFFSDIKLDNEWGKLVHNLDLSGVLGINIAIDEHLALHKFAQTGEKVLPSVFMPPLYAYFIYSLKIISNEIFNLVNLIILVQIILSFISIYIFFKIVRKFEDLNFSLIFTLIFSIFPLYVYSSVQISSVNLQIFLNLFYFYNILHLEKNKNLANIIYFSIFSGLLILIRGEFFLFYFFTLLYFFLYLNKNYKFIFISLIISLIIVTPYLKRNYDNFQSIVLTKSLGYNILKGNNPELKIEGSDEFITKNFNQFNLKIKTDNKYEINLDNYYKRKGLEIIKDNPVLYIKLYIYKIFAFLFLDLDSTYPGYYNPLHIFPKLILSLLSFVGLIISLKRKGFFQYLSLYYISNILIFSVFFILPRYSLIILPVQLFLSIEAVKIIFRKIARLVPQ